MRLRYFINDKVFSHRLYANCNLQYEKNIKKRVYPPQYVPRINKSKGLLLHNSPFMAGLTHIPCEEYAIAHRCFLRKATGVAGFEQAKYICKLASQHTHLNSKNHYLKET